SPRGMLLPAALRRGALRKRVAYGLLERGNLARAALLHATSRDEGRRLAEAFPHVPIAIIPNGVDVVDTEHDSREFRQRLGVPQSSFVIASLGRLHPIKRLDLLAAAFASLRAAGYDVHWVVAGPDETSMASGLMASIRVEDRDRVHLVGA